MTTQRDALRSICIEQASPNMQTDAVERQADRITDAILAALASSEAKPFGWVKALDGIHVFKPNDGKAEWGSFGWKAVYIHPPLTPQQGVERDALIVLLKEAIPAAIYENSKFGTVCDVPKVADAIIALIASRSGSGAGERITGASNEVEEIACYIWSVRCPGLLMSDDDLPHYEAAARLALRYLDDGPSDPTPGCD